MGWLHARRPDIGRLPYSARYILMELGLLLFMVQIAVSAGDTVVETFRELGLSLALCGAAITVIPVLLSFTVGRYLLKMNGAILLGAITGSMTSTAALQQVNAQAKSSVPMLGYVGTYALANILLALAGALMMRI
jgi:putative transport protein